MVLAALRSVTDTAKLANVWKDNWSEKVWCSSKARSGLSAEWPAVTEQVCILDSCCLKPMNRNSVFEELRVKRFAVIHEEICCRASWRLVALESRSGRYKRLCYCRETARRATSVEILWPFFDWAIDKKLCQCTGTMRAHCQLKSCKMLHKCSMNCIWKRLQLVNDLQGHSRSLPLPPFDRPYTISY